MHMYVCVFYIAISFFCICRRSNNYGTTPTLQSVERGGNDGGGVPGNGNNNNAPATPSQIFCLHGRSNNVEVEGKLVCGGVVECGEGGGGGLC